MNTDQPHTIRTFRVERDESNPLYRYRLEVADQFRKARGEPSQLDDVDRD